MRVRGAALAVACVWLSACSSSSPPPVTRQATPTPRPSPSPPPERETISVTASGVGAYMLAAIPVALLHNDALRHGAAQVVVHFVTRTAGGRTLGSLDSVPVNIGPGETLPVAANCTDACNGAAAADVTVTVGAWVSSPGVSFRAGAGTYRCGRCGPGHGYGSAEGTVTVPHLGAGTAVALFAACQDSSGLTVGGGVRQLVWPGGVTSQISVPVLVSASPATCALGASAGW